MTDLSYSAYNTLEARQPGDLTVSDMLVREVANLSSGQGNWAALAENASFLNPFSLYPMASGYYYTVPSQTDLTASLTQNTLYTLSLPVHRAVTFDRIGLEITTGVASGVVRLGIYNSTNGVPSTPLLDAGTIDASTTGAKEITISQAVQPGLYFLVGVGQGANAIGVRARYPGFVNADLGVRNANVTGWASSATVTGALPSSIPGLTLIQQNVPKVYVRVA